MDVVIDVQLGTTVREPLDDEGRIRWAHSKREDTPDRRFEPVWLAKELVYWCVLHNPRLAYHVIVRMPMGFDVAASSPAPAHRVARLLYDWDEVVRASQHLTPAQLSTNVLSRLGEEGEQLRAGIRYARSGRNGQGTR